MKFPHVLAAELEAVNPDTATLTYLDPDTGETITTTIGRAACPWLPASPAFLTSW